jgi:predicted transcriptional regulator YheO
MIMKKLLFSLFLTSAILCVALLTTSMIQKSKQLRHVVVFKYKQDATKDQIKEITIAFRELKNKIPGIVSFETGINNSPENLNKGFTHVYLITFKDAAARDTYLPHPQHKEFVKKLEGSGILEDVFVVDYFAE